MRPRPIKCALAALLGLFLGGTAQAVGPETNPTLPSTTAAPPAQDETKTTTNPTQQKKQKKQTKKQQRSELDFQKGFRVAYDLIYTDHDYSAGIAKLRTLEHDDHPDVANMIGYASRKLGRYDDSKEWYERALDADPRHARTWSYYGMWHAEQGNLLKAQDFLAKVEAICGTDCREYTELKSVIEGTRAY